MQTQIHLIITTASEEDAVFRGPSQRWIKRWEAQEDFPFTLVIGLPRREYYAPATPLAFRAGMRVLFSEQE